VDVIQDLKDSGRNPPGVAFLDEHHLVVHAVNFDAAELSSRKSADISSPFRLWVSIMDVSSGRKESAKEWRTRFRDSSVQVTSGGFAIRTGDVLRFLSKDFAEIKQFPLPNSAHQGWEIRVSTSGKTLLLNHYFLNREERLNFSHFEVLDAGTLKTRVAWDETPSIIDKYAITNSMIAVSRYGGGHRSVVAKEFGSAMWSPLFEQSNGSCNPESGIFVTDTLLVCGYEDFVLSTIKGEILFTEHFKDGRMKRGKVAPAQDGQHVAVMIENFRDFWDTRGRISSLRAAVYDLSAKKSVMTVSVSPPKYYYDVALSPDGSKLAILSDGTVSVYSVPIP
jgi:hypothetical protein